MADWGVRQPARSGNTPRRRPRPVAGDQRREDWRFLHSTHWERLRRAHLQAEPLCRECRKRGRYVPAKHVDHIIPRSVAPELSLAEHNLQSLCVPCHGAKTLRENRR